MREPSTGKPSGGGHAVGESQNQAERAKRAGVPPNRGHGDVSLPQEGDWRMILREGKVEIGNSGEKAPTTIPLPAIDWRLYGGVHAGTA